MERMILKLEGHFSIPSQAPNADLKAPLEISGFVDVDRLFKNAKRTFHDRENSILKKSALSTAQKAEFLTS
jgi:hypothetical protein